MYKVFLVEDEILVRESIREYVDWENTQYIFTGEAADGEMALPMIEELKPDILITDIKMPFIDGMELSRIVRKNMPWINILLISGHDEFEYAREAVDLGINAYLLKPISSGELLQALDKISLSIEEKKKDKASIETLNNSLKTTKKLLKDKFMNDFVNGQIPVSVAVDMANDLNLNILAQYYIAAIITAEAKEKNIDKNVYEKYVNVEQMIEGMVKDNPNVIIFSHSLKKTVLLLKAETEQEAERYCYMLIASIKYEIERSTDFTLAISVGNPHKRMTGITRSYAEAEHTAGYNYIFGNNTITGINYTKRIGLNAKSFLIIDEAVLLDCMRTEDKTGLTRVLNTYIQKIKGEDSFLVTYAFISISRTFIKFIEELGGNAEEELPELNDIGKMMMNINSLESFENYINRITEISISYREKCCNNKYGDILLKSKKFIHQYFNDPDISLNSIAKWVNISSSHFSTIFSQEVGKTFIEYLTEYRIKKAMEYLKTTSLKSSEIAYKIGYKEPHYFYHVFKKFTGKTPMEFRNEQ
jgi:two-component system response regulator YesN